MDRTHGRWMAKDGVEGSKDTRGEGWVPSPRATAADRWECPPSGVYIWGFSVVWSLLQKRRRLLGTDVTA